MLPLTSTAGASTGRRYYFRDENGKIICPANQKNLHFSKIITVITNGYIFEKSYLDKLFYDFLDSTRVDFKLNQMIAAIAF